MSVADNAARKEDDDQETPFVVWVGGVWVACLCKLVTGLSKLGLGDQIRLEWM